MSEKEKIVDKIKKLHDHAKSAAKIGSEAEAQAFAAMMQKLMSEHKILMSEIEHAKLDETDPVVYVYTSGEALRKGKPYFPQQRMMWMELLARTVAKAHYCESAVVLRSAKQIFIGRRTDGEAAKAAFDYLAVAAQHLASDAYQAGHAEAKRLGRPWRPGFRESWLVGFCQRLNERYDEELNAIKAKWANSGTALIRLTDAMTVVKQFMEKAEMKKAPRLQRLEVSNEDGYQKGRKAAEDVALKEGSTKLEGQRKLSAGNGV